MAITLFDQAIYSGSNFFISVVIGRLCSKQELGLYLLGFTILVFMSNVQVALISSAYTVYYPKIKDENDGALYTGSWNTLTVIRCHGR